MMDIESALRQIVGTGHVSTDEGKLRVSAANTAELSAVLALCNASGASVRLIGGGTKFSWGNEVEPDVVLELRRLDGIVEHVWQDMTASVRAGTSWRAMQASLAVHGQQVALDPLFADHATVGGICATNDSGAMRGRYGSMRDLVLGMTVVLADGTIARSGGKVVKNVAGYDLPKLMIGAFGTLGIITEVTFRLHPLPRNSSMGTITSDTVEPLLRVMQSLAGQSAFLPRQQLRLPAESGAFALDTELASEYDALAPLSAIAGANAVKPAPADVWRARDALFASMHSTVLKITCLPTKVAALLHGMSRLRSHGARSISAVSVVPGITWVALEAEVTLILQIVDDLRARLRADGGMVMIVRPGSLASHDVDPWGGSPPAIDIMWSLKHGFDPRRTLNRGIFVGGI